ncbi:TSUP family transporter [Rhodobacteraceae bacterium ASV31]|nr:TSUP family transporter [Anianabacter salinae]
MLQRLAGQGFGMVAAPLMALVAPAFLPATILLIGFVVGVGSTVVDTSSIARRELPAGFAGRILGAGIAAWIAASVAQPEVFAVIIAGGVYLGIALSLLGVRVPIVGATLFSAGAVAGVMGTLTGVGAPPMALLYQNEERRRSAAMQNVFFAFGMVVSIGALGLAGLIGVRHLAFAAALVPFALVGLRAARPLSRRMARQSIRPYALAFAGTAATILVVKQLL